MQPNLHISNALASVGDTIAPNHHGDLEVSGPVRLRRGRVHEVLGDSADMFAIIVASQISGPVVWAGDLREVGSLAPTAVQQFIDPGRLILTMGVTRTEVLWAGEQALRAQGAACVVIELHDGPDLTTSRRLQIAAEESGALGLVLISGRAQNSAAQTRWDCNAIAACENSWEWRCTKNKQGELGTWQMQWLGGDYGRPWETGTIHLAATSVV